MGSIMPAISGPAQDIAEGSAKRIIYNSIDKKFGPSRKEDRERRYPGGY